MLVVSFNAFTITGSPFSNSGGSMAGIGEIVMDNRSSKYDVSVILNVGSAVDRTWRSIYKIVAIVFGETCYQIVVVVVAVEILLFDPCQLFLATHGR